MEPLAPSPFRFIRVRAIVAVLFLCVTAAAWIFFGWLVDVIPESYEGFVLEGSIYLGSGIVLAVLSARAGVDLRRLLGPRPSPSEALRISALAIPLLALTLGTVWAVFLPLSFVAPGFVEEWLLGQPGLLVRERDQYPVAPNALVFLSVCVIAPVVEEFVCRGLILHRWAFKWTLPRAVILSSIFFGLPHPDPLGAIALGLVAAILYLETRSLYAAIILHMANNLIAFGGVLADVAFTGAESTMELAAFRSDWWIGLIGALVGVPWFARFVSRHWKPGTWAVPYQSPCLPPEPGYVREGAAGGNPP